MRNLSILSIISVLLMSAGCGVTKPVLTGTAASGISVLAVESTIKPFLAGTEENIVATIRVLVRDEAKEKQLKEIILDFTDNSAFSDITGVKLLCEASALPGDKYVSTGNITAKKDKITVSGNYIFPEGENQIIIKVSIKESAGIDGLLKLENLKIIFDNNSVITVPVNNIPVYRMGKIVREAGQDNIDTYRIPGIVTTKSGTLIAVFDNRYNNSKDLQEDIDVGMSRSTDGGQTWEPMKVIIDMGEFGGRPQRQNGAGDPCVLYDERTGTLWVAASWMSGLLPDQAFWWASKPGMSPMETGQFIIVKSSDDGLTWSEPVNITSQIKDPAWQYLLAGPGRGLTLRDGTLVFPAQFKSDLGQKAIDGGQYTCHSTIVFSADQGNTWSIGTGAKSNTTEAQVIELSDGSLMLNMRDDRNRTDKSETNGRAVAVTSDYGKTWQVHPSSNSALPEPNCMASLISADITISNEKKKVLFFSNPASKTARTNITIKASLDEGLTWPSEYTLELYSPQGYGYSCLTMVDDQTVGILYEGTKNLYFQKIPVKDILKPRQCRLPAPDPCNSVHISKFIKSEFWELFLY